MPGKGSDVNTGDLLGQEAMGSPAGVRAAIVAMKPGKAGGAKGGRKADASEQAPSEEPSPAVPAMDKQGEEDLWERYRAQRAVWTLKMLEALQNGVKGKVWFSLMDKIHRRQTLQAAWERVSDNAGACGVDGISVGHFGKDIQNRLLAVSEHLQRRTYQPQAAKRVWIAKEGSTSKRPLGISTVRDRVVHTSTKMVIEPIFEREFAEHSYGFRPGRGCKDALRRVNQLLRSGLVHVVDVDIKSYFDSIPHDKLMSRVRERIADGQVLGLIESFLKAGVMELGCKLAPEGPNEEGTPQGSPLSPLLANVYLNPLDWLMSQAGFEMVRYADDAVVLCPDAASATRALQQLKEWMEQAGLQLHPLKTKVVDMGQPKAHFDFLGYQFWHAQNSGKIRCVIRPKSVKSIKARLKPLTRRSNGQSLESLIARINPVLRGIYGYFKHARAIALARLDGWVRGRIRGILRKRRGLRGRGRGRDHQRWPNHYFAELGLYNLVEARAEEIASLRKGANC